MTHILDPVEGYRLGRTSFLQGVVAVDDGKAAVHARDRTDGLCREGLIHYAVRGDGQAPRIPEEEAEDTCIY